MSSGAHGLKLFPAETFSPAHIRTLRSVIAAESQFFRSAASGESIAKYMAAGASGFRIGGQLFRSEIGDDALRAAAQEFIFSRREIAANS